MLKKIICGIVSIMITSGIISASHMINITNTNADAAVPFAYSIEPQSCSDEFAASEFYRKLTAAKSEHSKDSLMQRTLAIAKSQDGYKNYSLDGISIERARQEGKLWTGRIQRDNNDETGNTEYTRWMQTYVVGSNSSSQYFSLDWCAIFVSWCMYQAGYYSEDKDRSYYYSYCADPRVENQYNYWIESFNFDQSRVWYTPIAQSKLNAYSKWNNFVNTNIDPYDIPYKPGGLIFFCWDGDGKYFDHVGIVVNFNAGTHTLTYISGNDDGQVRIRNYDFEDTKYKEQPRIRNTNRIMAYAEYGEKDNTVPKTITAESTSFDCERNNNNGITIKTNSESKTVSIRKNNTIIADYKNRNITIGNGIIGIGDKIINSLDDGENILTLFLEDGQINITVNMTEPKNKVISASPNYMEWDRSSPSGLVIQTNSDSDLIDIFRNNDRLATINTNGLDIHNGLIEISTDVLNDILVDGTNYLQILLLDGSVYVTIDVTNVNRKIFADNTSFTREKGSEYGIEIHTSSGSDNLSLIMNGITTAKSDDRSLYIRNGTVTISPSVLNSILNDGENNITLVLEDGLLDISVYSTIPQREINIEKSLYEWETTSTYGLRIRTDSDSDSVTLDCNSKNISSTYTNGIAITSGTVYISPDILRNILAEGQNKASLRFSDGSAEITVNCIIPAKTLTSDKTKYLIRSSLDRDIIIETNSDSENVTLTLNSKTFSTASDKRITISKGKVTIKKSMVKDILNKGENKAVLEFDDGTLNLIFRFIDDALSPTSQHQNTKNTDTSEPSEQASSSEASEKSAASSNNGDNELPINISDTSDISSAESSGNSNPANIPDNRTSNNTVIILLMIASAAFAAAAVVFIIIRKTKK